MISVIITGYKRPYTLRQQLDAIRNQTIKPAEIIFCINGGGTNIDGTPVIFEEDLLKDITVIRCNKNLGVWARFSYALNCKSEYICLFDDDTIPGPRWFENCLNTMETHEGLLGTMGIRFHASYGYFRHNKVGWSNPNQTVEEVDIVGHSWFFKKRWLSYFWRELPRDEQYLRVGEDIHFAYVMQKYGNLRSYVPPHPKDNMDMWGSMPAQGMVFGRDINALSNEQGCINAMSETMRYYVKKGFRVCCVDEEMELIRYDKGKFNAKLWELYKDKHWEKLQYYATEYINKYCLIPKDSREYNDDMIMFFLAYSELELGLNDDSKKHYMYIINNKEIDNNIKDWAYSNIGKLTTVFTHDFASDFNKIWDLILSKKNFAFSRACDGEYMLMIGSEVGNNTQAYTQDGWSAEGKMYKIGYDLKKSLAHNEDNYFYGICDPSSSAPIYEFYVRNIKQVECKITYSDIFINANYKKFVDNMKKVQEDVVFIGSKNGLHLIDHDSIDKIDAVLTGESKSLFDNLNIVEYFPLEHNCVLFYEDNDEKFKESVNQLALKYTNTLFIISAGPLSPIIVDCLYNTNPNNRYVDVGSATDEYIHRRKTRPYMHDDNGYATFVPKW